MGNANFAPRLIADEKGKGAAGNELHLHVVFRGGKVPRTDVKTFQAWKQAGGWNVHHVWVEVDNKAVAQAVQRAAPGARVYSLSSLPTMDMDEPAADVLGVAELALAYWLRQHGRRGQIHAVANFITQPAVAASVCLQNANVTALERDGYFCLNNVATMVFVMGKSTGNDVVEDENDPVLQALITRMELLMGQWDGSSVDTSSDEDDDDE